MVSSEESQLLANLAKLIKSKKAIEIGKGVQFNSTQLLMLMMTFTVFTTELSVFFTCSNTVTLYTLAIRGFGLHRFFYLFYNKSKIIKLQHFTEFFKLTLNLPSFSFGQTVKRSAQSGFLCVSRLTQILKPRPGHDGGSQRSLLSTALCFRL